MNSNRAIANKIAVDIGSTVVKIAQVSPEDEIVEQQFYPREFSGGIAQQVENLLAKLHMPIEDSRILVCSSANGGLRVGIVCLSKLFSGSVLRNQVLLAGANPVYVYDFTEATAGDPRHVDLLLIGGGIDCEDAKPLVSRLTEFDPRRFSFSGVVWAGNSLVADVLRKRFPDILTVANPMAKSLASRATPVFEALRQAYLDDIVYKEGISELRGALANGVRPTPEVVSCGFQRAIFNKSSFRVAGACILMDVGGATTDIHYTVELVRDDSGNKTQAGTSVARYVFTDLGIVASRDSTILAIRAHQRCYEFLNAVFGDKTDRVYRALREGDYEPSAELLSYACVFLALDRFSNGAGPGLPSADLRRLAQLVLTGGAAQVLDVPVLLRILNLFLSKQSASPDIEIDKRYRFWVDGLVWSEGLPR